VFTSCTLASFLRASLLGVVCVAGLAGCASNEWGFPYRTGVQQGNWITKDQVTLLRPGMSREQVRYALGTPTLASALHANRWDYPYYYRASNGKVEERVLTVIFEGSQLARWRGDEPPELQPFQLAREEVRTSQKEAAQHQLNLTREGNDAAAASGMSAPIEILPGVTIGQTTGDTTPSDPSASPTAPLDAPTPLR
jgi:outer membrane protein assembly factor BamE